MEELLKNAINHKEWNSAAKILISLYAEYVEGDMNRSRDLYSKYIILVDIKCIKIIISTTPFDIHGKALNDALVKYELGMSKALS